jgi:hypothetical protein
MGPCPSTLHRQIHTSSLRADARPGAFCVQQSPEIKNERDIFYTKTLGLSKRGDDLHASRSNKNE